MNSPKLKAYKSYRWIVADPRMLGGALTIRGTRYSVAQLLESLAAGTMREDIGRAHGVELSIDAVQEALSVASELVQAAPVSDTATSEFVNLKAEIVERKSPNWRSRYLATLIAELSERTFDKSIDFSLGLGTNEPRLVFESDTRIFEWLQDQNGRLQAHLSKLRILLFWSYPGKLEAYDDSECVRVLERLAERLATAWEGLWLWKLSFQDASLDKRFDSLLRICPSMADEAIGRLEGLARELAAVSDALEAGTPVASPDVFVEIDLPVGIAEQIQSECDLIGSCY